MLKGFVLGESEDTQDLIPGVIQDHIITDTEKDPILDITENVLAHIQYNNQGTDLLLDHTITGLTPEVKQEAEDTMGLEELYALKLIEDEETAPEQDLAVEPSLLDKKKKRELLEMAKANAAKTFGKEIVLPASLKMDSRTSENGNPKENLDFKNIMPRPEALKSTSLLPKNLVVSPTREEKKGSVGQWIPVKNEENVLFHNFSPKSTTFRAS